MKASIKLDGPVAAAMLRAAVKDMVEGGPVSQNEKRWSRWANAIEHFGEHEVTFDLDEVHLILMRGA
jgi:hypothetical protein